MGAPTQAEQIPEDSIVGYKKDTEELSMYNEKYSLSIEIVEYLAPTKNIVEIILLNNRRGDTAIQKKISIDSVEQKYWRFNNGIERINLTESYSISEVTHSFVRTENMYFDLILKSNDGDSIKTNLKFKYRGREKNALWIGTY